MHRQTKRRTRSGDPREICNQVPSRQARDFFMLCGTAHAWGEMVGGL